MEGESSAQDHREASVVVDRPFRFLDLPAEIRSRIYTEVLADRTIFAIRRPSSATNLRKRLAICLVSHQVHDESYPFRFLASTLLLNTVSDLERIPALCRKEALRVVYSAYTSNDYRVFGADFPRFTGLIDVTLKLPRCVVVSADFVEAVVDDLRIRAMVVTKVRNSIVDQARQHLTKINDAPGSWKDILPGGDFELVLRERFRDASVLLEVTIKSHWNDRRVRRDLVIDMHNWAILGRALRDIPDDRLVGIIGAEASLAD
ncbi:uncharacterized protein AB675_9385 [Cyphellophora attinorum]|uniref:F-box domain-containing protein n=1 Tax=Cyphellophora attinorum TaxID=1664694 RepID=A0A0N0NNF4_9EURO|nr:uncharacterized protein AB675_9385 [Phialophora attinorum]KPI41551.1 hypothetical protein AB675_9385 [Phialophora attinorum]